MYIIIDAMDDSVEFGPKLAHELELGVGLARIFLFKKKGTCDYGMMRVSEDFAQTTETALADYNDSIQRWGIITRCPSVNKISYENNFPIHKPLKLRIKKEVLSDGTKIYNLCKPK